jgi:hypothetical protein
MTIPYTLDIQSTRIIVHIYSVVDGSWNFCSFIYYIILNIYQSIAKVFRNLITTWFISWRSRLLYFTYICQHTLSRNPTLSRNLWVVLRESMDNFWGCFLAIARKCWVASHTFPKFARKRGKPPIFFFEKSSQETAHAFSQSHAFSQLARKCEGAPTLSHKLQENWGIARI